MVPDRCSEGLGAISGSSVDTKLAADEDGAPDGPLMMGEGEGERSGGYAPGGPAAPGCGLGARYELEGTECMDALLLLVLG